MHRQCSGCSSRLNSVTIQSVINLREASLGCLNGTVLLASNKGRYLACYTQRDVTTTRVTIGVSVTGLPNMCQSSRSAMDRSTVLLLSGRNAVLAGHSNYSYR
jgi:hypothetical protein